MRSIWILTFLLLVNSCSDSGVLRIFCGDCSSSLVTPDLTDDDNSATGFAGGTSSSITYTSGVLKQTTLTTNEVELSADWTPKWSSIIAYYKFDENSYVADTIGQVADSSPNGTNSGTPKNDATTSSVANGKLSRAAEFDTNGDYLDIIGAADDIDMNLFSIAYWYKRSEQAAGARSIIEAVGTGGTAAHWFLHYYNTGTNNLSFFYRGGGFASQIMVSEDSFPDGEWVHVAYTVNTGLNSASLYINGNLAGETNLATAVWADTISDLTISGDGTDSLAGSLDDFAIWNDSLDKDDVQTLYQRQRAKYASVFESRVMDGGVTSNWSSLSWITTLPFGKEAPDGGGVANSESSEDYSLLVGSTGTIGDDDLMDNVIGIYHMNETVAGSVGGSDLEDKSGNSNHCTQTGGGITYNALGVLGVGIDFGGASYFDCPDNPFDFGAGEDFAVSLWYQSQGRSAENLIGKFLGVVGWSVQITNSNVEFEISGGAFAAGGVDVQDGRWHHIFAQRDGPSFKVHVNGKLEAQLTPGSGDLSTATSLKIGEGNGNPATGVIDEVIIWNRALDNDEVLQLFRRGTNRLDFQLRTCSSSDCSDQEALSDKGWKGSDGTNQTYFSELENLDGSGEVQITGANLSIAPAGSRFIQYRVYMSSDDVGTVCDSITATCVPELESITIGN